MGQFLEIYDVIKETMLDEKARAPNLDFPVALLYKVLGLPIEVNTPIFQASRHFGWVANIRRQRDAKSPLYRPTQQYNGPGLADIKKYVPPRRKEITARIVINSKEHVSLATDIPDKGTESISGRC